MPETKQQVRYQWIRPILDKEATIKNIAKICPFSERSLKYWLNKYRRGGFQGLIDESTKPHHSPNKTPGWLRKRILQIKEDKLVGGKKIHWFLEREGIDVAERTINKILKQEGKTRIYRSKRKYIHRKKKLVIPGEMLEVDIKYGIHFGFGRWWYQYTAIDLASKWRFLKGYENRQNSISLQFLKELAKKTKFMFKLEAIKTDNDSVFTNRITGYLKSTDPLNPRLHPFDILCQNLDIKHYLITPGKPTQNGCVERSHRSDKDYFYKCLKQPRTIEEYNYKLNLWNKWYNDLPHCSLNGLSPNEYLRRWGQNVSA